MTLPIFEFKKDTIKDTYDLILGLLPMGLKKTVTLNEYKLPVNYDVLLNSIMNISEKGMGLYIVEPSFFWSLNGKIVRDLIDKNSFYINYCIQLPENLILDSSIKPYLIGIERIDKDGIFIVSLNKDSDVSKIINNLCNFKDTNNKFYGRVVSKDSFESVENEEVKYQKEIILQKYEDVTFYKLKDISKSVKTIKKSNELYKYDYENYTLITKQGRIPKSINPDKLGNLYKIELDDRIIIRDYMNILLKSDLGEMLIKSIQRGSTIPYISKKDLIELSLPIPSLVKQKEIIDVQNNLDALKDKISEIENEFSLSVNSSEFVIGKIRNSIKQLGKSTIKDKALYCIRNGESQTIEFKQTFILDRKTNEKNKQVELSALKTIVGFLNSKGGTLLIGIDDNSQIIGISDEIEILFKDNTDKYLLFIKDKIKERIGIEFFEYLNYQVIKIMGKNILIFEIDKSESPCCLDKEDFYIRLNPATEKIVGKKLIDYIFHRFKDYT